MHATSIVRYSESFRQGRGDGNGRLGGEPHSELLGKTVGLVGYGRIGQAVALLAKAFGMRVLVLTRSGLNRASDNVPTPDAIFGPADAPSFFSSCDFVVVACPLKASSRGMIGSGEIEMVRRSVILINVSRAEVVQEAALYEALKNRRIAAAALDVWYQYPSRNDELLHGSRFPFHELPNVIATPHLSGWTFAMIERRCRAMAENLGRLALGQPLKRVVLVGSWRADLHEPNEAPRFR